MADTWRVQTVAPILVVRDVRRALARYGALGFATRVYGTPPPGEPLIYGFLRRGDAHLHLALAPNLDPDANTTAVYLYVDDPDAIFREWTAAAPEGDLEPPRDCEWGMREMTYLDPDGNLLRVGRVLRT